MAGRAIERAPLLLRALFYSITIHASQSALSRLSTFPKNSQNADILPAFFAPLSGVQEKNLAEVFGIGSRKK